MWVFAILFMMVGVLVLVVVALLLGPIITPIYEVVVNDSAVQAMGYDTGAETAMRIGSKWVLPLLALVVVVWFLVLRLRTDQFQGARRRR